MSDSDYGYEIGGGEDELARACSKGRGALPRRAHDLAAAGIRAAMRVLDLGCAVVFRAAHDDRPELRVGDLIP
jgi:hypothetical protein